MKRLLVCALLGSRGLPAKSHSVHISVIATCRIFWVLVGIIGVKRADFGKITCISQLNLYNCTVLLPESWVLTEKQQFSGGFYPWPRVQTEVPFAGDSLERYLSFTTDRPHDHRMPPPAGDKSRLSGFCCAHRLCVRSPCQAHFAHAHIWWKQLRDINYEPQGRFSSPEPNMFGGDAGTSPGERPHDVIAGESPARWDFPR